jgi:predicted ATP-grasp superfamily ATP-dependent carboligase
MRLHHDGPQAVNQYARTLPPRQNAPAAPEKQQVSGAVQLPRPPIVLLLGNYRPALAVARSLSRHGYRIMMGLGGGEGCGEYSRFVDESWDHPALAGTGDEFFASLLTLLNARRDIEVIYPVAEEFVRFVAEREDALPERVTVASPRGDTVRTCCDKLALLRVVEQRGVDHLPFRVISAFEELTAAANEIGFPVVIRPINNLIRLGDKKALIARDETELGHLLSRWPDGQDRLLLQRYARGERHNVFFAAQHGRILRSVETRILRTDRTDGTGLAVDGETVLPTPQLREETARLLESMNYTGIGLAQFILDPESGRSCFLELNPRIAGSHAVTEQTGAELSRLAIDLARSEVFIDTAFSYRPGMRYAWTYGELRGILHALRNREIGATQATRWALQMLWSALFADLHQTWRRDDPLPTIMLYLRLLVLSGKSPKSTHFRQGFIKPTARG